MIFLKLFAWAIVIICLAFAACCLGLSIAYVVCGVGRWRQ